VCELGFDGLDINMGCPSRSVASSGSGAGLIRTPDVAQALMQAARQGIADWAAGQTLEGVGLKPGRVAALRRMNEQRQDARALVRRTIPVSVKTRLGYDSGSSRQSSLFTDARCSKCIGEKRTGMPLLGRRKL